ncbi:MAG: response regulator [Deltaproteobacteria bacterium]|nr:response regulator [Deltaproteobacteria bacterium]
MFPKLTRVLIVDDSTVARHIVRDLFDQLGFTNLSEAPDGAKAYDLLCTRLKEGQPIELVISDWNMPILDGIGLLKKIRSSADFKPLPLLMLTSNDETHLMMEAIEAKVDHYLVKPPTLESLRKKLEIIWKKYHPSETPS